MNSNSTNLLTNRYTIRLVLSSAMLQFCSPYSTFAHTDGLSSSLESTIAERSVSNRPRRVRTSDEELSIRCNIVMLLNMLFIIGGTVICSYIIYPICILSKSHGEHVVQYIEDV